ncbi:heavy metal translocating P-type ATPase [Sphingosinicella sp. LY1275]|uniref:heavy metal translocating P-type ATPase n=1 Tax=Sphingosinicella sp. LY1275 TaxID=3095379 RepID=UPI002ADEFBE4|nr:heavy metal translocating P-type ATPase [Sphingosinicella sp. LY1275]MEA1015310.1 heavy metal translocating P-type ATPase [Sphingosinicella sp. LY1275]
MTAPVAATAEAALAESVFAVPSMRCAGCISKLESGLAAVPGIAAARVNFTAKRVRIAHEAALDQPRLVAEIERIGFPAEPISSGMTREESGESKGLVRRMAVAGFAMMNIMLLSVSVWSGATGATRDLFHWVSALIAIPTVTYAGWPFFTSAWAALRHGRTNMDVPIAIGVILVTAMSLFETFVSGPHAYFDGAVSLLFFLLIGRVLDSVMRDRARDAVTALLRQTAKGALVLQPDGSSRWFDAAQIEPGMRMIVASGERLAADGLIEAGTTRFDLSLLTGESAPQPASPGTAVHAGTLNLGAPVTVRVTAAGEETVIADIARMMDNAAQTKSRYVRIADRAARYYAPAVHTLALLAFTGWMLAGADWHQSVMIAVAVLIITCPCALGLAVPAAQIVASGALSRAGILIKDGSALERLAEADRALFDKTGTLTLGRPEVKDPLAIPEAHKSIALALAQASRHPLSEALRRRLSGEGIVAVELERVAERPGEGVEAWAEGRRVWLGRDAAMDGLIGAIGTRLLIEGEEPVTIAFEDRLREAVPETLARLRGLGIEASILSGDRASAVAPIARTLGLCAQTSARPEDKLAALQRLAGGGCKVLMVGDGLNDGPALAAGHVSMAPASASDVGQTAADAVFLGDSFAPIAIAITAARRTMRVVRQNFVIAIGYNIIAVPLAIFGLVTPLIAALAMSGSSLIVIANALRLRSAAR